MCTDYHLYCTCGFDKTVLYVCRQKAYNAICPVGTGLEHQIADGKCFAHSSEPNLRFKGETKPKEEPEQKKEPEQKEKGAASNSKV